MFGDLNFMLDLPDDLGGYYSSEQLKDAVI